MPAKPILLLLWLLYQAAVLFVTARADAEMIPVPHFDEAAESEPASLLHSDLVINRPWEWTPRAEHHQAVVRIICKRTGAAGSAVYVRVGKVVGLLTAEHVVSDGPPFAISWPRGLQQTSAWAVRDRLKNDLAFVFLPKLPRDVMPLEITDSDTQPRERLEVAGYGGPGTDGRGGTLRHYWVTRTLAPGLLGSHKARPGPMHGDSGGGILRHKSDGSVVVVGVVSAGEGPGTEQGGARWYGRLIYPSSARTVAFCTRVNEKFQGTQCPPGGCRPGQGHPQGGYELYPPEGFGPRDRDPLPPSRPDWPAPRLPREPENEGRRAGAAGPLLVIGAFVVAIVVATRRRM